jgi:hypothetical protein
VLGEQGRRGHRVSWRPSSLGADLRRAVKPICDLGGGGDTDLGRSDHRSRENRVGEADAGVHRWEQGARKQEAT